MPTHSTERQPAARGPLVHVITEAISQAGLSPQDIDAFIPHQNLRVAGELAKRTGLTNALLVTDGDTSGNTSSAAIPLAIGRTLEEGGISSGQLEVTYTFGAGMTAAAQVITLPAAWKSLDASQVKDAAENTIPHQSHATSS